MMDAREVAGKLTKAQRAGVLALGYPGFRDCHDRSYIGALHHLECKRLAEPGWSAFPRTKPWRLTLLGAAVKAALLTEKDTHDGR